MYSSSQLSKYEYFKDLLECNKIEYIIDSLTGLVSRKYMIEFVKDLIKRKISFRMSILDLDYFKKINDDYGHSTGDYILENFGNDLIKYLGNKGIAGRIGGDEFLLIAFELNDYNNIHKFFFDMFHNERVLRKHYMINKNDIFLTGTLGCATYPDDAKSFDELFLMCDKTLYRGKSKGRNCFIIYVHEKHKDLEIQRIHNDDLPTILYNINTIFEGQETIKDKILETSSYIKENLRLDKIYFIDGNNMNLYDSDKMNIIQKDVDLSDIKFKNELHKEDYNGKVNELHIGTALSKDNISSLMIYRINVTNITLGYIMFALERTAKIWQNDELAILMYFGKTIAINFLISKIKD